MLYKKPIKDKDFAVLYAYTVNTNYLKEFKRNRDMNLFILEEIHMKRDEYKLFTIQHDKYRLINGGFYTYDISDYGKKKIVNIVCTIYEENKTCLTNISDIFRENFIQFKNYIYLKDKYIDLLDKILYTKFYHFYNFEGIQMINVGEFKIDELKIFLNYYGHTFKKV